MLIYHERQEASLCGQHCLNNLLGGPYFSGADLADLAAQLDAQERELMLSHGIETQDALNFLAEDSGNVDESGNFSEQVLRAALERSHNLSLLRRSGQESPEAFVCNHEKHWIALRCVQDQWFDLNSLLDRPRPISAFYLDAYLHQLEQEGYDIFAVEGSLPIPLQDPTMGNASFFHPIETLLAKPAEEAKPEAGGQRLGSSRESALDLDAGDDLTHDEQLQIALAMSLADADGRPAASSLVDRLPEALPAEPTGSAQITHIRLRLPDGSNVKRDFSRGDPVSLLWVMIKNSNGELLAETVEKLRIRSRGSGQELELAACLDSELTFEAAGLAPSAAVFVVSG
mmetsp:Transcript_17951/g.68075  ORF Transcript_17951/g.68075 Transcript_17951/m.68075 type:complete len:343 (-) Transcript_17951:30-1058(-)